MKQWFIFIALGITCLAYGEEKEPEKIEDDSAATAAVGGSSLGIRPASIAIPVNGNVRFRVINTVYEAGDIWAVSDLQVGTIVDRQDGTAIYTQLGLGENVITFSDTSVGILGTATAVGIPVHDHSSLGNGGPAFGVYGSE